MGEETDVAVGLDAEAVALGAIACDSSTFSLPEEQPKKTSASNAEAVTNIAR